MNEDACDRQKTTIPTQTPDSEFPDWENQPQNPPHLYKASLKYHQIKCAICNHPECNEIEEAFLNWTRPGDLAQHFKLGHRTVVYRHAHALGLFKKRARNARRALEPILEESGAIPPTASEIIRAVRAYSCINEYGKYTHPSRRLIITHLDAQGNEIPADKVDPDWKLARPETSGPSPQTEERLALEDAALEPVEAKDREPRESPVQSRAPASGRTSETTSPKMRRNQSLHMTNRKVPKPRDATNIQKINRYKSTLSQSEKSGEKRRPPAG